MDEAQALAYQLRGQEALQQQANEAQIAAYAPSMQEQAQQAQAVLVSQTNPNKVIEDVGLKLSGQVRNPDGSISQVQEPLMNKRGVARVKFILSTVVNQNTILSHLENREISKLMIQLSNDVIDDLTLNWKEYDINDKMLLDHIINAAIYPAFFAIKRALEQNEKNWLRGITVEHISGAPRVGVPKKEGFWGKFRL